MNKNIEKITVIIFYTILTLLSVLNLLKSEVSFSDNENRVLTKFGDIKINDIFDGEIDEKVEKYLSDQFIFRDSFVSLNTWTKLRIGYFEINDVYFGEDGYLFNKYDYSYNKYLNKNIEYVNDFVKDKNVYFTLVPSSSGIVDKLPKYAYSFDEEIIIDYIYSKLNTNNVNLYNKLENQENIYYKLDHHWNHLGSYIGYKTIIKEMLSEEVDNFQYELVSNDFKGTTYSKSGAFWLQGEDLYKIKLNNGLRSLLIDDKESNSIYFDERLDTKDKYSYYLDGNHALVQIESDINNGKHLLLIKDSYAHILIPYLMSNYETITMVDLRYYNQNIHELINKNTDILFVYSLEGFVNDTSLYKLK